VIDFGEVICTLDEGQAAKRDARVLADPRPPERRLPFRLPQLQAGRLVLENGGGLFVQPVDPVADGKRLDDFVGPRFLVMTRDAAGPGTGWWTDRDDVLAISAAELDDAEEAIARWFERRGVEAVVVRPDRYVMWAGAADEIDAATRGAAESLLGRPVVTPN
jgi:3-(3-hydroxy-phenyl)propionate hydroxylase